MRLVMIALSCLVLTASGPAPAEVPQQPLAAATDLAVSPDGPRVAVLLPGATVRVIETRDGWSRVSLEGWIRAENGVSPETAPTVAPSPAAAPARDASIAGSVFITDETGRTAVGAGIAVRLLRDPVGAAAETTSILEECDRRRAALKTEADALKDKGSRAMKTIENPGRAFEAYDEARRQRSDKLREMKELDAGCDARVEKALDARTVRRALSDTEGRFAVEGVPPGDYSLHVSFESGGARHVWDVDVTVAVGQRLTLDLTNANRTRSVALPVYR